VQDAVAVEEVAEVAEVLIVVVEVGVDILNVDGSVLKYSRSQFDPMSDAQCRIYIHSRPCLNVTVAW
jgi:hypothetical protein